MVSQLLSNSHISFVVSKPFTSRGVTYSVGDDFPQEEARDIEVFVRARYVMPVIDDMAYKPKAWHRELQLKEVVLEKLNRENVQLRMPAPYDTHDDNDVDLEVLLHPEKTPEPDGEQSETRSDQFNPSDHTVAEVNVYIELHPDDADRVRDIERSDRGRRGIVGEDR